ncbi:MAG TPA: AMP-dependent synthetase/ligase [Pirellulaceae bacterium]|nr:AMP-dependent synthetase/ligase [Pirellulaceae bacterium]
MRPARTVCDLFISRVHESADSAALFWFDLSTDCWRSWTWNELAEHVGVYAEYLLSNGVQAGSRVMLLSENCREWIVADLAILSLGAVNVPLHSELTTFQVQRLIEHCEPCLILASSDKHREKTRGTVWNPTCATFAQIEAACLTRSNRINDSGLANSFGDGLRFDALSRIAEHVRTDDLLTILYTSGTTGEPKGVMLSHRNVCANVASKLATLPLRQEDVRLCILPMSHIFARVCDLYTWLMAGCQLHLTRGWPLLFDDLREVRPTYINGVPYFYEKCYRELEDQGRLDEPNALRELLGGRPHVLNCGGATLAEHVYHYFASHDVGFVAGYGLTEASPVLTSNRIDQYRIGSVGQVVPGVEIRLSEDNEILARGDNIMLGYFKDPVATAATIVDGWLQTGDIGEIDRDGFLYIVGRKKELIVTTGAKKIAPLPIENKLSEHPAIEQCLVYGEGRDFLVALIVPDLNWLNRSSEPVDQQLRIIIDTLLRDYSKYEQIGRFAIVQEAFSIENDLLTAKRSKRRDKIIARYRAVIDGLYESESPLVKT